MVADEKYENLLGLNERKLPHQKGHKKEYSCIGDIECTNGTGSNQWLYIGYIPELAVFIFVFSDIT